MVGFIIEIEQRIIQVAADTIHVIFSLVKTKERKEIFMDIRGSNWLHEEYLNWGSWKLEIGDKLRISVVDVKSITKPTIKEIKATSEEKLKEEMAIYLSLKQELEKAKLL
jgi:subtilisin-like proprotein convertase family protein